MAKRKLISDPSTFPDLTIIGVISQLKDYRLAFYINREQRLNLVRLDDIPVFFEKENALLEFPFYSCYDPERRLHYYLMSNNHKTNKMIPAYKQADFLLMIKGQAETDRISSLIAGIRKTSGIQMVFQMKNDQIKNLEGIMADLELHLVRKSLKGN